MLRRTNYALLLASAVAPFFLRRLSSLPALGLCCLACLCLNDTFASALR